MLSCRLARGGARRTEAAATLQMYLVLAVDNSTEVVALHGLQTRLGADLLSAARKMPCRPRITSRDLTQDTARLTESDACHHTPPLRTENGPL